MASRPASSAGPATWLPPTSRCSTPSSATRHTRPDITSGSGRCPSWTLAHSVSLHAPWPEARIHLPPMVVHELFPPDLRQYLDRGSNKKKRVLAVTTKIHEKSSIQQHIEQEEGRAKPRHVPRTRMKSSTRTRLPKTPRKKKRGTTRTTGLPSRATPKRQTTTITPSNISKTARTTTSTTRIRMRIRTSRILRATPARSSTN
jgi:hypothetical protein